jgi:hypothetical protein
MGVVEQNLQHSKQDLEVAGTALNRSLNCDNNGNDDPAQ